MNLPLSKGLLLATLLCAPAAGHALPGGSGAGQDEAVSGTDMPSIRMQTPDIPFTRFVLPNGLTVIHSEDRRTPTVSVQVWYRVGSKDEPKGRSGFAHLFEHLMFNGSENFNDEWFKGAQKLGAYATNGTTAEDRTNYYQTVPKGGLDGMLWLESDRMGHLLGAIDQAKLDEQRRVVQNEKRQSESAPLAMVPERIRAATLTSDHPYGHSVIGSMEDLNAATLEDVKQWFRDWYGPNNAILVLVGDLTLEEARSKAEKYFGPIPGGAPVAITDRWVQKIVVDQRATMQDRVAGEQIYRVWNVPGANDPDSEGLDAIATALAGDANARLAKRMIYDDGLANSVSAQNGQLAISGQFMINVELKPGADRARAEAVIDEELKRLLETGPTPAELGKARVQRVRGAYDMMESIGGKGSILASGELYARDPGYWRATMQRANGMTPKRAAAAGKRWLTGASFTLVVEPFPILSASADTVDRSILPPPVPVTGVPFPKVSRFHLSNGIEVLLAERHEIPKISLAMDIRSGLDPDFLFRTPGTSTLAISLLDDGTTSMSGLDMADRIRRLGATFSVFADRGYSTVVATTLLDTLDPTLRIWSDAIRSPAFGEADFRRERSGLAQGYEQLVGDPSALADKILFSSIWRNGHPYGRMPNPQDISSISREEVVSFHRRWFGSNNARIIIVGDTTEAVIKPKLEAAFGNWQRAPGNAIDAPDPELPSKPSVILVDAPEAQQSVIRLGLVTTKWDLAKDDAENFFNSIFGGGFTGRLNMNLREAKGWSYGAYSGTDMESGPRLFTITAPVQTNATKDALAEIQRELNEIAGKRPPSAEELEAVRGAAILALAGQWGSSNSISGALYLSSRLNLSDDYWDKREQRIRSVTLSDIVSAGRGLLSNRPPVWVVVGDLARIEKDVRALGLGEVYVVDQNGKIVR